MKFNGRSLGDIDAGTIPKLIGRPEPESGSGYQVEVVYYGAFQHFSVD